MKKANLQIASRVTALETVLSDGVGLLRDDALQRGTEIVAHASGRLRHGTDRTVVALAGATGSGKSSLFNALVGEQVAPAGVIRPTTEAARAAVFGDAPPPELLGWLGVRYQHGVGRATDLDGLILIDLPDHDSVVAPHRIEVSRLIDLVDAMVWVLDPQKYADEALHNGYLRPMARHAEVMMFALNQADLVPATDWSRWRQHAASILRDDGIGSPNLFVTSAVTGEGLDTLRGALRERIGARDAALHRLDADLRTVAASFGSVPAAPRKGDPRAQRALSAGLAAAAGAMVVGEAVAAGYRHDATRRTGWPFARWVLRLRRHPMQALRPAAPSRPAASPPTAVPVDPARASMAVKEYADERSGSAETVWSRRAREVAAADGAALIPRLSAAMTGAAHAATSPPRWWGVVGWLQWVLAASAATGAVWLAVLAVFGYLKVPTDALTPRLGEWPIPTLLLLGGALAGIIVAWVARPIAALGGRRRAGRAVRDVERRVAELASEHVIAPLEEELRRWERLRESIAAVGGR
jgi:GTP-binding protein EngB required for normal cell division